MTDSIGDLITRIRNGYLVRQERISLPYSVVKEELAKILKKEGYLEEVEVKGKKPQEKQLVLDLKYQKKEPVISQIKQISKPSLRVYFQTKDLRPLRGGYGLRIISTSKGLMTDREAKKANLGGEVICQLW